MGAGSGSIAFDSAGAPQVQGQIVAVGLSSIQGVHCAVGIALVRRVSAGLLLRFGESCRARILWCTKLIKGWRACAAGPQDPTHREAECAKFDRAALSALCTARISSRPPGSRWRKRPGRDFDPRLGPRRPWRALPVKKSYKRRTPAILNSECSSCQTSIEPGYSVRANNSDWP